MQLQSILYIYSNNTVAWCISLYIKEQHCSMVHICWLQVHFTGCSFGSKNLVQNQYFLAHLLGRYILRKYCILANFLSSCTWSLYRRLHMEKTFLLLFIHCYYQGSSSSSLASFSSFFSLSWVTFWASLLCFFSYAALWLHFAESTIHDVITSPVFASTEYPFPRFLSIYQWMLFEFPLMAEG